MTAARDVHCRHSALPDVLASGEGAIKSNGGRALGSARVHYPKVRAAVAGVETGLDPGIADLQHWLDPVPSEKEERHSHATRYYRIAGPC